MRAAFAITTDLFQQYGIPRAALRILRMVDLLREKGAEVHMVEWIRWPTGLPAIEVKEGIHYVRVLEGAPAKGLRARARFLLALNRRVRDALVAAEPAGVVVQDAELLGASLQAGRTLGVPVFYDSHEHFPGMVALTRPWEAVAYAALERYAARRVAHVFTSSHGVAERFRRMGSDATVIHNSQPLAHVAKHRIPRPEAKRRLGLAEDSLVLGFTGPLTSESGLEPCLRALPDLPERARIVILGGPEEQRLGLEALAARLGVADRVTTRPFVPEDEATRVACAFDVGLLTLTGSGPNYVWRSPGKMFEYMALGLPTLYSDYPEMRHTFEDVGSGVAVPPGDAAAIAREAGALLADDGLREAMGRKAERAFAGTYCGERQKERLRTTHRFWR